MALGNDFVQLQRGVLASDRNALTSAWGGFDRIVELHPDWPYARLGLAIAALEIYSRRYPLPATYDGVAGGSHYDGYTIQVRRALQAEPAFQPLIDWLAETISTQADREQPDALLRALEYVADSAGNSDPRLQLILARAERLEGDAPQSVRRIRAYLSLGGDSGVAALDMARSLAMMDTLDEAATEYMIGARVQTVRSRAAYRLDLAWVATPNELGRFDSLPSDSIGRFVAHFWMIRDQRELRPAGSRLQEHLRRWVFVNENFRVSDPSRRSTSSEVFIVNSDRCAQGPERTLDDYEYIEPSRLGTYRTNERVLDHRAIVYMRHGEPLYQFGGPAAALTLAESGGSPMLAGGGSLNPVEGSAPMPRPPPRAEDYVDPADSAQDVSRSLMSPAYDRNVTWVYLIGGEYRAFTFVGHHTLGQQSPTTMIVFRPPNQDVLLQLAALSPSYARLAARSFWDPGSAATPESCHAWYQQAVRQQQEGAGIAVRTDTYLRRFTKPLATVVQFSAMGQPDEGTGELVAAIALRAAELREEPAAGDPTQMRFVVRVRIAAIDSLTGEAVRIDSVRRFVAPRQGVPGGWLPFLTILPLKPGLREVRVSVEQDDDRGSLLASAIQPASPGFASSDIVLGTERGSVSWRRRGTVVPVSPSSAYAVDEAVALYYELYGLTPGADYRTRLSLRRAGDAKVASTLSFSDRAATTSLASSRTLTLSRISPGLYDLVLIVEEVGTGRRVQRERAIAVQAAR